MKDKVMYKKVLRYFGLLIAVLCSTTSVVNAVKDPAPWTILVYIAADNSLSDFAQFNIDQMKLINNPKVNILVYWCPPVENGQKIGQKLEITYNNQKIVATDRSGVDSGSRVTLSNACGWAINSYPSDKFALVLWNHGSGILNRSFTDKYAMRGFCYDDTTGNNLTDIDLRAVLTDIKIARNNKKTDIVGFDACLMAGCEVASGLSDLASYLVASEQTEPGYGWDYSFLKTFTSGADQLAAAKSITTAYNLFYKANTFGQKTNSYTMSTMDLSQYTAVDTALNNLSLALITAWDTALKPKLKLAIQKSISRPFDDTVYIDMITFSNNLIKNIASIQASSVLKPQLVTIKTALTQLVQKATALVVLNVKGSDLPGALGVSLYLPQNFIEPSYASSYFAPRNNWSAFITKFIRN
jgi:hypothetical protein